MNALQKLHKKVFLAAPYAIHHLSQYIALFGQSIYSSKIIFCYLILLLLNFCYYSQLFGETADDEDISPDMADPEAQNKDENAAENGEAAANADADMEKTAGNVVRVSTRQWAKENNYDAAALFNKFFFDDINYLLSMSNLWKTRKPPTPIKWDSSLLENINAAETQAAKRQYHKIWSLAECAAVFAECLQKLKQAFEKQVAESGDKAALDWDKDDQPAMDFVAACANIRAYIFEILRKSRFEVKSMAGNIIPAIATTNAITAGVVVLHTFRILQSQLDKCKSVYMRLRPNPRNQLLVPEKFLTPPNPNCYVCAAEPAIHLKVDTKKMKIKEFRDEILIKTLNMVNPDVIVDAKGVVVISSEEGETECNENKLMSEMEIVDGVLLKCDDFFQNYELSIIIMHIDAERDEPLFEVIADKNQLQPKTETKSDDNEKQTNGKTDAATDEGPSTSKKSRLSTSSAVINDDSDDDLCVIEDDDVEQTAQLSEVTSKLQQTSTTSPDKHTNTTPMEIETTATAAAAAESLQGKSLKRKPAADEADNYIQEILDSDEETDNGPTQSKRTRVAHSDDAEVIAID